MYCEVHAGIHILFCAPMVSTMPDKIKNTTTYDAPLLYSELVWIWPIISPPEDYVKETVYFGRLIETQSTIPVTTLLHLGCGGGHNDFTFKKRFTVTGVDISDPMLGLAGGLNPEAEYAAGDMRTMRLERLFDAVALLDAINHMTVESDLRAVFLTAWEHLRPGGIFLTVNEVSPGAFVQNKLYCTSHKKDGVEIAFVENLYDPDPSDTSYEHTCLYLIRRDGELTIRSDRCLCGLFDCALVRSLLEETGFAVEEVRPNDSDAPGLSGVTVFLCEKPPG